MVKTLALLAGTLAAVYGLAHSCAYAEKRWEGRGIPYEESEPVDKSQNYLVYCSSLKMTLPGYEIARRPPDTSIEEMLNKEKAKQIIAQTQER